MVEGGVAVTVTGGAEEEDMEAVADAADVAEEVAEAELIGTTSVLVNPSPVTPMMVCATPVCRKKVPWPLPQSQAPAPAFGSQHHC